MIPWAPRASTGANSLLNKETSPPPKHASCWHPTKTEGESQKKRCWERQWQLETFLNGLAKMKKIARNLWTTAALMHGLLYNVLASHKFSVCELVGTLALHSIQKFPFLATGSSCPTTHVRQQDSWSSLSKLKPNPSLLAHVYHPRLHQQQ